MNQIGDMPKDRALIDPPEQAMAQLAAIVESSEDAIISKTLDGIILTWNKGAEHVYGYPAAEAIGRPMTMLLPPDRADEEAEILEQVRRGEPVQNFETVRRTRSGEAIDVSLTISPIRDRAGRIIGASHMARNITERKREQERLQQLAAVVESSDDAIVSKTLDGTILTWNAGAEHVYGYSAAETIGRKMLLLLPANRQDEEAEILDRIRRGVRVEHFETVRRRKSGELIDVSLTISPVRDRSGRIVGGSHVARNITDRKRIDEHVQRLAAVVESSEDAIISKTLEGKILTWNRGAERVYGYPESEAIGRPMTLLLPEDRMNEEAEILNRIRKGDRVDHFETVRRTKDGGMIDVSLTISPVRDHRGRIVGASHVARNITDRKQLDAQLRHAQKLESLGVLAGGVAHDFNNLLTGILGNTSLALDSMPPDEPVRRILRNVLSASERASHLTRQLLAYAGKGRFVIEPVDLSALVRDISNLIETSIPKNVRLRLELGDELPPVQADASQLQQVVMNLVINGAEAIPADTAGSVIVTTGVRTVDEEFRASFPGAPAGLDLGKYVSLEVHDTGSGMDEATLARIFDPFFTTKFTGRGLGLAAVQGIVSSHRGLLKVDSHPGKGTTFTILLPATEDIIQEKLAPAATRATDHQLILVIDDEEIIRRTAKAMLEHYGYTVVLAENGKEGAELFEAMSKSVSAVLLDMTMPVMNGEETLVQLKAIRPEVPVILSSGYNEVDAIRRFMGKGIAGFIQKPYAAAALAEKVKLIIQTS